MKLKFSEFLDLRDYEASLLVEKQILYNNGKRYGQIVFIAGGAGSGKGFAIKHFMQGEIFKVLDVDELKKLFQKLDDLGKFSIQEIYDKYGDNISEKDKGIIDGVIGSSALTEVTLKDFDLTKPNHVYALHMLVKATGAKEKILDMILDGAKIGKLPNILFDITFKDTSEFKRIVPSLLRAGYVERDIHLTWVLTNYEVAIRNNKTRDRVVPEDILLSTHRGAAQTIYTLVKEGTPKEIDGSVYVILNNRENTIPYINPKTNKPYKTKSGEIIVKDFTYLKLKDTGKPSRKEIEVKKQLLTWIKDNVPSETLDTSELDNL
jgi:sporulation protein YlmC with PRC-barrel domain